LVKQLEICVSKIQSDVITRGILTSVMGFERKLIRYIREYSKGAMQIRWIY
jgi:hypothetical protein